MKLVMPAGGNGTVTAAGKTISLLIAGNNEIYYYNGDSLHNMYRTDFSSAGLRSVISSKRAIVENNYGHAAEMVVLIKPTGQSSYRNIVDVLDEMLINQVSRYVLMDADESEIALIGKN